MKTALFLCTGNYYRSRFAELLFNNSATLRSLNWRGSSRGLGLDRGSRNVGPMDKNALERLRTLEIAVAEPIRFPRQVSLDDLSAADLIIALDRAEHVPLIRDRYPGWENIPIYWDILDRPPTEAYDPLNEIATRVDSLIAKLHD